jgi:hypothetical protein
VSPGRGSAAVLLVLRWLGVASLRVATCAYAFLASVSNLLMIGAASPDSRLMPTADQSSTQTQHVDLTLRSAQATAHALPPIDTSAVFCLD